MKQYYELAELAEIWKITQDEILYMAAQGKVILSVWWRGYCVYNKGYEMADWDYIDEIIDIPGHYATYILQQSVYTTNDDREFELREGTRRDGRKIKLHISFEDSEGMMCNEHGFVSSDGETLKRKTICPPAFIQSELKILPEAKANAEAKEQTGQSTDSKDIYVTGEVNLCKAFGVGPNSMSGVRRRVKKAGKKFTYDPETRKKRLLRSEINEILAKY